MVTTAGRQSSRPTLALDLPATGVFALIALFVPAMRYAFPVRPDEGPIPITLDDDAFFYLTIARNIVAGLGPTFDGLSPTNGFHPVWLGALIPLAALAPDSALRNYLCDCMGRRDKPVLSPFIALQHARPYTHSSRRGGAV